LAFVTQQASSKMQPLKYTDDNKHQSSLTKVHFTQEVAAGIPISSNIFGFMLFNLIIK